MGLIPSWLISLKNYSLLENRVGIHGAWTNNRATQNDVRCLSEPVPRGHSSLSPMRPQCLGGIVLCEHMLSDSLVTVWPSGQVECSHRVRYVIMEIPPPKGQNKRKFMNCLIHEVCTYRSLFFWDKRRHTVLTVPCGKLPFCPRKWSHLISQYWLLMQSQYWLSWTPENCESTATSTSTIHGPKTTKSHEFMPEKFMNFTC